MALTGKEAAELIPQWGSYIHNDDPGRCFYAFPAKAEGRPVSEAHRRNCLDYIDRELVPCLLREHDSIEERAAMEGFDIEPEARDCSRDWRTVVLLRRFIASAPLYVEA